MARVPDAAAQRRVEEILDRVELIELSADIRAAAGVVHPLELRSLDAIHLATALSLGRALGGFFTYDRRLGEAAELAGLRVLAPR